MKKIISVLLSCSMFSSVCFAEPLNDVIKLLIPEEEVTSSTGKTVVSFELNQPVSAFDEMDSADFIGDVDLKYLVEEITDAKLHLDYKYELKGDKKADFNTTAAFDLPIHLSESLKIDAWAKFDFWGKFDLEEIKNAKFEVISDIPLEKNLIVTDIIKESFAGNPNFLAEIDFSTMKDVSDQAMRKLAEYAEIEEIESGYILKLSNDKFEKVTIETLKASATVYEDLEINDYIENVNEFLENFDVLGKDGLSITLIKDSKNNLKESKINAHICFNMYDIMTFYDDDTEGMKRENSVLDFDVNIETESYDINNTKIEFPEISEDAKASDFYSSIYTFTVKEAELFKDNAVYYPIEAIAKKCGYTVEYDGKFLNSTYNADEKEVISTEFEPWHFVKENGKLYCTATVLEAINVLPERGVYNFDTKEFKFTYMYYPDNDEEKYIDDTEIADNEEIPVSMYFSFTKDGYPYIKDNTLYMPVTDFLENAFVGELSVTENIVDFVVTEKNALEINGFAACFGDDFVYINGDTVRLDSKVQKYEGALYIPVSFLEKYGIRCDVETTYSTINGEANTRYWGNYYRDYYDDYTYEPAEFYYSIDSDLLPYRGEKDVYIPARYLFEQLIEGEMTPLAGGFEYIASGENDLGIKSVKAFVGDNFIYVNDEKISLDENIIMDSDRIQIPVSFLNQQGFENVSVEINGHYGVSYSFIRKNPDYKGTEY